MTDLQRYKHDTYPISIAVVDDAGSPVSLSGATLEFRILDSTGSTAHTLSVEINDASRGLASVTFSTPITPGSYRFVVGLQDSAGFYRIVADGTLRILEDFSDG